MCGIAVGFDDGNAVELMIQLLRHRGPDAQQMVTLPDGALLGHTRLSILDTSSRANQPFKYGHVWMAYNGECWNYIGLRKLMQARHAFVTESDTEVLAAMLSREGPSALSKVDGMFTVAWHHAKHPGCLFLARDRYGEMPLYYTTQKPFLAASEMKALVGAGVPPSSIRSMKPGTWARVTRDGMELHEIPQTTVVPSLDDMLVASKKLTLQLERAVLKRTISDVPVCTMLSGGLDSSLITSLLTEYWGSKRVTAYTGIHNPQSTDLKCARRLAADLGIKLVEVPVPTPTLAQLREVVRIIECPLKVQVEIGWACCCLAAAMHKDGYKVVFSGEGSDELWASYGFAYAGIRAKGWHRYRKELYASLQRKNYPRNNKIFMAQGIECRQPFADVDVVPYALSLSADAVRGRAEASCSKKVLAMAAADYVPEYITKRQKVAFQVGLGLSEDITKAHGDPSAFYKQCYKEFYE